MRGLRWMWVVVSVVAASGCGDDDDGGGGTADAAGGGGADAAPGTPDAAPPGTPDAAPVTTMTADIGPAGGTLAVDGASVTFPAGAVATSTSFTLTATAETVPGFTNLVQLSPVYDLTPHMTLAMPITYSITSSMNKPAAPALTCLPATVYVDDGGEFSFVVADSPTCDDGNATGKKPKTTKHVKAKPAAP